MNRTALIKNGFWITYGAIANRLLSLLSNLILARLLLPSDFGVIAVAYIFWSFVNLVTQGTAGDFLVYKGIDDKRYLNTTYTISIGVGLLLSLGMIAVSPIAAQFFDVPNLIGILTVFSFNLSLSSVQSVYQGVLKRRMQFREIANGYLIASFVRVVSTSLCAFAGLSYWSFVIGDTAYWVAITILYHRLVKLRFQLQIDSQARSEVFSYCIGATGSSFGFYVNSNWDNLVAGRMLGSTNLGYYNFAYQITTALNVIVAQVMNQLGMSVFARIEKDAAQEKALLNVTEQVAFLAAPIFALFFLLINERTIAFIFGDKWLPSLVAIPWLLVFSYFRLVNTPLINMLAAKGKPGVNAKVNLQIAPIAVLSFIIGAHLAGISGVSIAVAITLGIGWTVYWWWVGCRELQWQLTKFLMACFVPALITLPSILICLNISLLLRPLLFLILHLLWIRLFAPQQFLRYESLFENLLKWASKKWKK